MPGISKRRFAAFLLPSGLFHALKVYTVPRYGPINMSEDTRWLFCVFTKFIMQVSLIATNLLK